MGPARKPDLSGVLGALVLSVPCFGLLAGWLSWHGYVPTPSTLADELLALSLQQGSFLIRLKSDFLLASDAVHRPMEARPLWPLLLSLLGQLGIDTVGRAMYAAAAAASLLLPALVWAASSPERKREALLRGGLAFAFLLLCAGNPLLDGISSGSASLLGLALFLVSWGFRVRGGYALSGALSALTAWCVPGGELVPLLFLASDLVAGHRLTKARSYWITCGIGLLPWFILAWPFYRTVLSHPFEAQWARTSWFPDTDSGLGHLFLGKSANMLYQHAARARWLSWSGSYTGEYLSEVFTFGAFLFLSSWPALRFRELRASTGLLVAGWLVFISIHAFSGTGFDRGNFFLVDGIFALWLVSVVRTLRGPARTAAVAFVLAMLAVNLPVLLFKLGPPAVGSSALEGRGRTLIPALARANPEGRPVLVKRGEGWPIALLGPKSPVIELPDSFVHSSVADALVERFGLRLTTAGTELGPYLKSHSLRQLAPEGIWEILPANR